MIRIVVFFVLALAWSGNLFAKSFGKKSSHTTKRTHATSKQPKKLKPGQFIWKDVDGEGAVTAEISLSEQKLYLYRAGNLIGISTISSGKEKYSTPTGVFTVMGKNKHYLSKKYNNTPMPYAQWLTTEGIAMHAGQISGHPASHGCIRLPEAFAQRMFKISSVGMSVTIKNEKLQHLSKPSQLPALNQLDRNSLSTLEKPVKPALNASSKVNHQSKLKKLPSLKDLPGFSDDEAELNI